MGAGGEVGMSITADGDGVATLQKRKEDIELRKVCLH